MYKKSILALFLISLLVAAGTAHSNYKKTRNLKVLPPDITDQKLDSMMQSYTRALGVSCDFCHAADPDKKQVTDFASDKNPVKDFARKMMQLTIDINKNYFNTDSTVHPAYLNVVNCFTCHKGDAVPQ